MDITGTHVVMRVALRGWVGALGALLLVSNAANAQSAGVIGIVRDAATGEPLSGALIGIRGDTVQRNAQTNLRGEFRLGGVPRGDYRVSVRRIGFVAVQEQVRLPGRDTSLAFVMHAVVRELDTVRVNASGPAIFGVIGTTQGVRPLPGALVQVMGLGRSVSTDSAGQYFIDIARPGTYLLRVAHAGYTHQLLTVEVPADGSMETSTLLDTMRLRERWGTAVAWENFERRITLRGTKSALITAAELEEHEGVELSQALNRSRSAAQRGLRIGTNTCVFIDGFPRPGWPVDAFKIENVYAVELYGPEADATQTLWLAWPNRLPCSGPPRRTVVASGLPAAGSAAFVVIWIKP